MRRSHKIANRLLPRQTLLIAGPLNKELTIGVSQALEIFIAHLDKAKTPYLLVDTMRGGSALSPGIFNWKRFRNNLLIVLDFWLKAPRSDAVYLIVSSSLLGFLRDMLMILPARILGKTVVLHLHGGGYRQFYESSRKFIKILARATLSTTSAIIVLARNLRDQFAFLENWPGTFHVVPNGLPIDVSAQPARGKTLPEADQPFELLYLSNLMPTKGYLDVLEAAGILHKNGFNIRCHFCGSFLASAADAEPQSNDQLEEAFHKRIRDLGLEEVALFHGHVKGNEKEKFLREAHAFLLPTYYPWEGQPMSIIEALASGLPVITTNDRGMSEQVIDGKNGYFVPPRDPQAIAGAVMNLAADSARYAEMSVHARRHYEENYTQEQHLDRLFAAISTSLPSAPEVVV